MLLPDDNFTYISKAWHTTSWLDPCISTADAPHSLEVMRINYELVITDHLSLSLSANLGNLPAVLSVHNNMSVGKIGWSNLPVEDLVVYLTRSDTLLSSVELPKDAIVCRDINCKNQQHGVELSSLYESIVKSFFVLSRPLYNTKARMNISKRFMLGLKGLSNLGLRQADRQKYVFFLCRDIIYMWQKYYCELFNCVKSFSFVR